MYEYNSYLDADILDQVVEIVAAMMSSKHKEILKGVLSFIKASLPSVTYNWNDTLYENSHILKQSHFMCKIYFPKTNGNL